MISESGTQLDLCQQQPGESPELNLLFTITRLWHSAAQLSCICRHCDLEEKVYLPQAMSHAAVQCQKGSICFLYFWLCGEAYTSMWCGVWEWCENGQFSDFRFISFVCLKKAIHSNVSDVAQCVKTLERIHEYNYWWGEWCSVEILGH